VSKRAGRPGKRVARDERVHQVPPEALGHHGSRQIPEHRIVERGDDQRNDGAGVKPHTARKRGWLNLAERDNAGPRGKRAGGTAGLLDGVAGQLQHSAGQRRGPKLTRHVDEHQADTAGRKHCRCTPEGDEAGGAVEGQRDHAGVAEKPRRVPKPWGIGVEAHMNCHRAIPL